MPGSYATVHKQQEGEQRHQPLSSSLAPQCVCWLWVNAGKAAEVQGQDRPVLTSAAAITGAEGAEVAPRCPLFCHLGLRMCSLDFMHMCQYLPCWCNDDVQAVVC